MVTCDGAGASYDLIARLDTLTARPGYQVKPKSLCSERANPRTATIEAVISTAQMAICATSKTSRTVIRRPILAVDPAFTTS